MRKKQEKLGVFICLLLVASVITGASGFYKPDNLPENFEELKNRIVSPGAILVELYTDSVLFEKNSEEKIYPASLTKIMTVLLVLEKVSDLNQYIVVPNKIFQLLQGSGASTAGFLPGEMVCIRDLLYGTMLPSGADAALTLAYCSEGSERAFVSKMNQKAKQLNMNQTHFNNVTGLHDPDHYSSVKDLALLLRYALKNEKFRRLFCTASYSVRSTNRHLYGFVLRSTLADRIQDFGFEGGRILGGKTGYTPEAGLCLASLAACGAQEYIFVTVGAPGNHRTEQFQINDAFLAYRMVAREKEKMEETTRI